MWGNYKAAIKSHSIVVVFCNRLLDSQVKMGVVGIPLAQWKSETGCQFSACRMNPKCFALLIFYHSYALTDKIGVFPKSKSCLYCRTSPYFAATTESWSRMRPSPSSIVSRVSLLNSTVIEESESLPPR